MRIKLPVRPGGARGRHGVCTCVILLLALGCGRGRPPDVVVVVVDTLRADRLGVYGSTAGLTPFLDQLARQGTVFQNAYATSSWTCPSIASLFTSRYPSQHGVTTWDAKLPDAEATLAERLAAHGYVTLGFSANLRLTQRLGYDQGFRTWAVYPTFAKLRGDRLRRRALAGVDAVRTSTSSAPLFLYLQYMEPHPPYDPPARYRRRFQRHPEVNSAQVQRKLLDMRWELLSPAEIDHLASLYDGEVAFVDAELRRLFAALEARGILRDAIVVLTADHGEEFDEHKLTSYGFSGEGLDKYKLMSHGFSLYNQELRVPFLLLGRGVPAGRVVTDNVSLVDVAPTLLALAGLPADGRLEGRSLVPLLHRSGAPVDVLAELPLAASFDVRRHTAALVHGTQKVLVFADSWAKVLGEAEIYDLAADLAESRPVGYMNGPRALPPDSPVLAGARPLLAALREAQTRLARTAAPPEPTPHDAQERQRLRALGYVD